MGTHQGSLHLLNRFISCSGTPHYTARIFMHKFTFFQLLLGHSTAAPLTLQPGGPEDQWKLEETQVL